MTISNLKDISFAALPYFLVCGTIYHISYWEEFNFDILPYLTVIDIIKSAGYTVVPTLIMLCIHIIFIGSAIHIDPSSKKESLDPLFVAIPFVLVIFATLMHYFVPGPFPVIQFGIFLISMAAISLVAYFLKKYKQFSSRGVLMIALLGSIPLTCMLLGNLSGRFDKYSNSTNFVSAKRNNLSIYKLPSDSLKYLGKTEDYFILSPNNHKSIILISRDNVPILIINTPDINKRK